MTSASASATAGTGSETLSASLAYPAGAALPHVRSVTDSRIVTVDGVSVTLETSASIAVGPTSSSSHSSASAVASPSTGPAAEDDDGASPAPAEEEAPPAPPEESGPAPEAEPELRPGTEGDDRFEPYAPGLTYLGLGGTDTLVFAGAAGDYRIGPADGGSGVSILDGDGQGGLAVGVERFEFAGPREEGGDVLAFDVSGDQAGAVYRLYAAALDRTPDEAGFRHWLAMVETANGFGLGDAAAAFAASEEFGARTGGDGSAEAFVAALYGAVLAREADADGLAHWTGLLEAGEMTRPEMLLAFSESDENVEATAAATEFGFWLMG